MLALAFTNDCVETTGAQSPKTKGRHSQLTQHSSTSDCIQLNAKWEMGKQTTEVTSEHTVMSVFAFIKASTEKDNPPLHPNEVVSNISC